MARKRALSGAQKAFAIGVCCLAAAYCAYALASGLTSGRMPGLRSGTVDRLSDPEWFIAMAGAYALGIGLFVRAIVQAVRAPEKSNDL